MAQASAIIDIPASTDQVWQLIGGFVRYDPEPLDPAADGNVLICCSRPESPVELDL